MNLITSIPAKVSRPLPDGTEVGDTWTELCIAKWHQAGFKVHSLNSPAEIDAIQARFPHVTFHPAKRDARAEMGKPLVYLRDMLEVVAAQDGDYVAVTNADVLLLLDDFASLGALRPDGMAYSTRVDVDDFNMSNPVVHGGVDFVLFHKSWVAETECPDFVFGTPWWDYWLPMATMGTGRTVTRLEKSGVPIIAHLRHAERWDYTQFAANYHVFMRSLAKLDAFSVPAMAEIAQSFSALIRKTSPVIDLAPPAG